MNRREQKIHRALLELLKEVPEGLLLPEATLRADLARMVQPLALTAEIDEELRRADRTRRIVGISSETGTKWKLSDAGRAWLAENP